jgi:hypothetical protein
VHDDGMTNTNTTTAPRGFATGLLRRENAALQHPDNALARGELRSNYRQARRLGLSRTDARYVLGSTIAFALHAALQVADEV